MEASLGLKSCCKFLLDQHDPEGDSGWYSIIVEIVRRVVMECSGRRWTVSEPHISTWRGLAEERKVITRGRGLEVGHHPLAAYSLSCLEGSGRGIGIVDHWRNATPELI